MLRLSTAAEGREEGAGADIQPVLVPLWCLVVSWGRSG